MDNLQQWPMQEYKRTSVGVEEDHLQAEVYVQRMQQQMGQQDVIPEGTHLIMNPMDNEPN